MDRKTEFSALLEEPAALPDALTDCVAKARRRAKRHLFHARWGAALASVGGVAAAFVLAVNLSLPFALACGRVPILKDLTSAVAFSPSLREALRHDFVQPIGESQTVNGVTLTVDYVIADKKQANIFYHLNGDFDTVSGSIQYRGAGGKELTEWSGTVGGTACEPGHVEAATIDFHKNDTPPVLQFYYRVDTLTVDGADAPPAAPTDFTFQLSLDADMIGQGESYPLHRWVELDGQRVELVSADVYPTYFILNLAYAPDNTAWLKGLDFYVENETGRRSEGVGSGVTASGSLDSPALSSVRQESTYFWNSESLTLHITGCTWLDKDRQYVTVDLKNGTTADRLPDGVELGEVEREGDDLFVSFDVKFTPDSDESHASFYQIASGRFFAPDGTQLSIDSHSIARIDPAPDGYYTERDHLGDYPWDTARLEMMFSRGAILDAPVSVDLK